MNCLSLNIKYLFEKENLSEENYGKIFGLKRGAIQSYITEKANPKIETLQNISAKYNILIDDLINLDISKTLESTLKNEVRKPQSSYGCIKCRENEVLINQLIGENNVLREQLNLPIPERNKKVS